MSKALLWPLLAQIVWTIAVGAMTGRARLGALQAREVKLGDVALGADAWPDRAKQWGNNFSNQFETPVLFYALCLAATQVGATGWIMAMLAWAYVGTRVGHTLIHTGGNDLRMRFNVYLGGVAVLAAMAIGVAGAMM